MNQKTIAKLAHVSPSTVSKALSGSKEISGEVIERVRKVALEVGYFQQKNSRKLEYQRKQAAVIAILCPEIVSIHYSRIVTAAIRAIEERGGKATVYVSGFEKESIEELAVMLTMREMADAMIIIEGQRFEYRAGSLLPIAYIGCSDYYDSVAVDLDEAVYRCIAYLRQLGHTRIGYIGEPYTKMKLDSFLQAMERQGLQTLKEDCYEVDARFEEIGKQAVRQMLGKGTNMPTAVLAAYDEIALAAIAEFEKHGIKVPDQISVVGMNDVPYAAYARPSLTTLRFFLEEQCDLAVEMLYERIFQKRTEPRHIRLKAQLMIRESTAGKRPKEMERRE